MRKIISIITIVAIIAVVSMGLTIGTDFPNDHVFHNLMLNGWLRIGNTTIDSTGAFMSDQNFVFSMFDSRATASTGDVYTYKYIDFPSMFMGARFVLDSIGCVMLNYDILSAGIDSIGVYEAIYDWPSSTALSKWTKRVVFSDSIDVQGGVKEFRIAIGDTFPYYYDSLGTKKSITQVYAKVWFHQTVAYKLQLKQVNIYGHYVK